MSDVDGPCGSSDRHHYMCALKVLTPNALIFGDRSDRISKYHQKGKIVLRRKKKSKRSARYRPAFIKVGTPFHFSRPCW